MHWLPTKLGYHFDCLGMGIGGKEILSSHKIGKNTKKGGKKEKKLVLKEEKKTVVHPPPVPLKRNQDLQRLLGKVSNTFYPVTT